MGYPEWVWTIPSRDLSWNDDTPEFVCEECFFTTNNEEAVEIVDTPSKCGWKCPACGHFNKM